jgi:hypothetical protein
MKMQIVIDNFWEFNHINLALSVLVASIGVIAFIYFGVYVLLSGNTSLLFLSLLEIVLGVGAIFYLFKITDNNKHE